MTYLDTGCFVKLYYPEADSVQVIAKIQGKAICHTPLRELEFVNALQLKLFLKNATSQQVTAARALVEADLKSGVLVPAGGNWRDIFLEAVTEGSVGWATIARGPRSGARPSSPSPHDEGVGRGSGRGASLCSVSHGPLCKRESAEAKAERIIAEELARLGWSTEQLGHKPKTHPGKLALAARLRTETILTVRQIAARLQMRTWKSANSRLHHWSKPNDTTQQQLAL